MAGVDLGGLQVAVVDTAGGHEAQRAVDLGGQRLVARPGGRGADELAVPVVHRFQRRQSRRRQRPHQVHRRTGVGVGPHQAGRVVVAHRCVGREAVDHVAAVGLQAERVDVGRARLRVLARDAGDLHHRHARAVGQHHRHLQQRADVGPDVRLGVVDERLGAVAALQQERLAARDVGQLRLEPLDLRRHGQRRHALQNRPHRLRLVGGPARLLGGGLGQGGVEPLAQVVGQRRQIRQLVDGYVDGPVHPSMVTARRHPLCHPYSLFRRVRPRRRRLPARPDDRVINRNLAGCAWRRPARRGRRAGAVASAATHAPPRTAAAPW